MKQSAELRARFYQPEVQVINVWWQKWQSLSYPPYYHCLRLIPHTSDKGRVVIFVIAIVLKSGARRRNHTFQKISFKYRRCETNELKQLLTIQGAISNYWTACPLLCTSWSGLQIATQTYATLTEQIHSSHRPCVHAEGLLHFLVRVGTSHTA